MLSAIIIIILIMIYCNMSPAMQLGAIIVNILIPDSVPYIDELVMIGIYLAGKTK